jgi:mono/diheme cytochrome c family protein
LNSSLIIKVIKFCCLCLCVFIVGCRGYRSDKEPIHLNPNLDFQAKFKAQSFSEQPVSGTVPWGNEQSFSSENRVQYDSFSSINSGKKGVEYLEKIPVSVTASLLKRGQERYDIYCSVCHDKAGSGNGMIIKRGFVPPPHLSVDRIVSYSDGELFNIISDGIRNMPGYERQLSESDRWAVVSYVRALQKANHSTINDVPEQLRNQVEE